MRKYPSKSKSFECDYFEEELINFEYPDTVTERLEILSNIPK